MRPLDPVYAAGALLTSPLWLYRLLRTGRIRTDWAGRFGRGREMPAGASRRLLLHAVSVGEVSALRTLVPLLRAGPDPVDVMVSVTTDTGIARAQALFGDVCPIVRYPFDFSWSVRRLLDRCRPDAVACVELELWPNFTAECARRDIPVAVINGRLSERSARRYVWVRPFVRQSFARLAFAAVQDETIAGRFRAIGARADRVCVTGTMKWDAARIEDAVDGAAALGDGMEIDPAKPLVVAGSTAPDEHAMLHAAVPPGVQLLCAPRRPEWFDGATAAMPGCRRRTDGSGDPGSERFLLDTIGELRQAYALADVVVVGRSFGGLYGSDMMEPVALGKPTIVGPAVSDFQATVDALVSGRGIVQTDRDGVAREIARLLDDPDEAKALAERGRAVICAHQGASQRHASMLRALLSG